MLKAKATDRKSGREYLLLGLSQGNVDLLMQDRPVVIKREDLGIPFDIIILGGKTEGDIADCLKNWGVELPMPKPQEDRQ